MSFQQILKALAMISLGSLFFSTPWFLRNFILTSDPIYPLGQLLVPSSFYSSGMNGTEITNLTRYENFSHLWKWNQWLYYSTATKTSDYFMHLGWPLLQYIVVFMGWRQLRSKPWISVVILTILFSLFSPSPRIFFPIMGLVWLFLPHYIKIFTARRFYRIWCSVILFLVSLSSISLIFHAWFLAYNRSCQYYLLGLSDDDDMLMKDGIISPVVKWVRDQSPKDSRIWVWCEDKVFYLDRWVRPSSPYDFPVFLEILQTHGTEALTEEIEKKHINFVMVNTFRCALPLESAKMEKNTWSVTEKTARELSRWMKAKLKLIVKDHRFELYQVK